jgi:hypothetical protein
MPPLEILARSVRRHGTSKAATLLFDSYDAFLALLDGPNKRAICEILILVSLAPTRYSSWFVRLAMHSRMD